MNIDIYGVPLDFGSGRRGVDMGPSAIRYAGLLTALQQLGHLVTDFGNLEMPISETTAPGDTSMKYLDAVLPVVARLATMVADTVERGNVPLVLGGDHSLSLGSIAGASRHRKLGVVWLDAHADFNTHETTPSGNIHGMPLAALCGYGADRLVHLDGGEERRIKVSPQNVAIIGARDLDADEKQSLKQAGVAVYSMDAIDRLGIAEVVQRAVDTVCRGTDGIYLSVDLDAVDPTFAPGVGTPVAGGLTFREAHLAVELVAETELLIGMDIVECNTILDNSNSTAALAVQLAASAFGKRIW
jgi:arginase